MVGLLGLPQGTEGGASLQLSTWSTEAGTLAKPVPASKLKHSFKYSEEVTHLLGPKCNSERGDLGVKGSHPFNQKLLWGAGSWTKKGSSKNCQATNLTGNRMCVCCGHETGSFPSHLHASLIVITVQAGSCDTNSYNYVWGLWKPAVSTSSRPISRMHIRTQECNAPFIQLLEHAVCF